jgi:hypothetical protein
MQSQKWGYIDKTGALVIQPQFDSASGFSDGLAAVQQGQKWGYIDKTGAPVIQYQFSGANDFSDGLAAVWTQDSANNGLKGYINLKGDLVWNPSK